MPHPILIEAAVESVASAGHAVATGADRLELCADLARGGVSPSAGLIRAVRERVAVPVMVLVRPRPGDFVYAPEELDVMCHDIREARRAGVNGVVIGALTSSGEVDLVAMRRLVAAADKLQVVMHRAVDQVGDLPATCEALVTLGVHRVLTSGGAATAVAGTAMLAQLEAQFTGRLGILAGGQIRADTVVQLLRRSGVREVHLGPRRRIAAGGMGERDELDVGQLEAVVRALRGYSGEP